MRIRIMNFQIYNIWSLFFLIQISDFMALVVTPHTEALMKSAADTEQLMV